MQLSPNAEVIFARTLTLVTAPSPPPALQGSRPSLETAEPELVLGRAMTTPAIVSDPFRAGSGNGALGDDYLPRPRFGPWAGTTSRRNISSRPDPATALRK